jgi:hypothetical protein
MSQQFWLLIEHLGDRIRNGRRESISVAEAVIGAKSGKLYSVPNSTLQWKVEELQEWNETLFTAIKGRRLKFAAPPPAGHVMFNFGGTVLVIAAFLLTVILFSRVSMQADVLVVMVCWLFCWYMMHSYLPVIRIYLFYFKFLILVVA